MSHDMDSRLEPGAGGRWPGVSAMLVTDGDESRSLPEAPFRRVGLDVARADSLADAKRICSTLRPRLVFLPLNVDGRPAADILSKCLASQPAPVVVVIASHNEINAAAAAMRAGAFDCLFRPFSPGRLEKTIIAALKTLPEPVAPVGVASVSRNPAPTFDEDAEDAGPILAASQEIRALLDRARMLAASDAPVIITGEGGTGKSLFAQEIHASSPRARAPLALLNAPTLTPEMFELEVGRHAGEGTLVFEEICELDARIQCRLLALIDEQTNKNRRPRIIATTRHDPQIAIREGRLRAALYYRLNVATVALPPLRGRGEDIALIARTRLREHARAQGNAITGFSEGALELLTRHDWPGNVRELVNLIWSLALTEQGPLITPAALPDHIGKPAADGPGAAPAADDVGFLGLPLAEIERRVIEATIHAENGSVPRAARVLDVSPSTLYRKLENWAKRASD